MGFSVIINLLEKEYWWGGAIDDGPVMPFGANREYKRNLDRNNTYNQAAPLLLSNKGRFVWCESGFAFEFRDGCLILTGSKAQPKLFEGYGNLRGAYLAACARFFPPSLQAPPQEFFFGPQYNSWIEMTYNQNQRDILEYARKIKETGMPSDGIFMIDCGWSDYYGKFEFAASKFPNPKAMVEELHALGFKVMLWVVPLVSADTPEYRFARDQGLLIRDRSGRPSIKEWWDGFSAFFDFTNPDTIKWFDQQLHRLMEKYGIDGYKLDAGDAHFYAEDDVLYAPTDCNGQSEAWAMYGLRYPFNEYRAAWKCGCQALVQRLRDKNHSWDDNGVSSLVPCQIAQGIIGLAFTCPDMIGGGQYTDFYEKLARLDQELFVRYAQCAALMPMMQFSAAPWRVLDQEHFALCREAAWLHVKYAPVILELVENARKTGEPIVRFMEYVFPNQGLELIVDQFMLGNDILVAPVMEKGATTRKVALPWGLWKDAEGNQLKGGKTVTINAPLSVLPIFTKVK